MITIFNRKELITVYSMQSQAKMRDILTENGIDYKIRVVNRKSPSPMAAGSRAHTGTFGENLAMEYEYIFYVKREDVARASHLVSRIR
ncbi:hypothetical protein OCV99_08170 [Dorea acetigenes]|jgi:hypothetical protein|uniref:DUF2007 domain-containing protein n=1 Tax=Dorea acetigenes TaxID=2981787 RepID=A0ABT2RM91_9FIRM|nr:hypothetical protein [Dorea acetigenes]MCU6686522.1 hypothetical protein [Dorea acetigenes]SCI98634.1 Uncharacterised protein [uncultured Clostridium sp.]